MAVRKSTKLKGHFRYFVSPDRKPPQRDKGTDQESVKYLACRLLHHTTTSVFCNIRLSSALTTQHHVRRALAWRSI